MLVTEGKVVDHNLLSALTCHGEGLPEYEGVSYSARVEIEKF